ncbi:DinB family protein [Metabacillus idriensis]|uniref:DinB family protein n=1 Tax=Metabacillus idriensis TaxID=324768 RepID=UPI0028139AC9|nr:DinB family protein [Metabacillus idriensis]MDR0137762.1 DinB family protein [Metabacillus idriensis]
MSNAVQLYDFNKWSNIRVFNRLKELPKELYTNEIVSVFPALSHVMVHIYLTDALWLKVIKQDSFESIMAYLGKVRKETENRSLEELEMMFEKLGNEYELFLNEQADPERTFTIEHPQYGKLETNVSELIQHVTNHGTYHRGNITAMLRQQGVPGVPLDYVFYLYEKKEGLAH